MRRESPIKYLAELLEFLPDATLVADRDGLIRMANTRAERIFGYLAHELVDQPVEILVPLQYRSSHRSLRGDFAKNPHNLAMSERPMLWGCRKDQSQFPAEIELNVIETREGTFVVAAIRDVSFKLAQSRELAMHHTLFSTLAGSVEAAVWVHNPDYVDLHFVNDGYSQLMGGDPAALHSNPRAWIELVCRDDRDRVRAAADADVMRGGLDESYGLVRSDGRELRLRTQTSAIRSSDGELLRILAVTRTIE